MIRTRTGRKAFTLVEMLVVMAVVIVLAGMAALVLPGAISQDKTTDGASTVRQYLMIAKNRAARDGQPRGIRFITGLDPNTPAKTNPFWATEIQEIEVPASLVFNTNQTTLALAPGVSPASAPGSPYVALYYTLVPSGQPNAGSIATRRVFIRNLTQQQAAQVGPEWQISIPEFNGYWGRIIAVKQITLPEPPNPPSPGTPGIVIPTNTAAGLVDLEVQLLGLADHADDFLGGATQAISFRFALYGPPSPLLGQQPIALPKNICVDLSVTSPQPPDGVDSPATSAPANVNPKYPFTQNPSMPSMTLGMLQQSTGDYDILFAPSGQVLPRGAGATMSAQIFLWVRDYTKGPAPLVVTGSDAQGFIYDMNPFRSFGEQQIVSVKSVSGALGVFPVTWPQQTGPQTGQYAPGQNPFTFARAGASAP